MPTVFRFTLFAIYRASVLPIMLAAFLVCAGGGELFAGEFKKADCWFEVPRDRTMTCGTLRVPENRQTKTDAEIVLSAVVFEPDLERHEPIVFLTGGPGQPVEIGSREDIDGWWDFIGAQSWMIGRRVVVVDQRGIGKSDPSLDCSPFFVVDHWNSILPSLDAESRLVDVQKKELLACRSALIAKGIDLNAYTSEQNAEDINDLRKALGIEKWVLYGVSYGTLLALEVMNQHPEGVSASILDSVVPMDINYLDEDGPNLDRSLAILQKDCLKANGCKQGLAEAVHSIARQLDRQPALLRSAEKHPRYTYVSGANFLDLIFGMLYDRETIPSLPELIVRTYKQDYRPLTDIMFEPDDLEISQGMDFSVTCSDTDPPDLSGKHDQYWANWAERSDYTWACPLWLADDRPASLKKPRRLDIPTLLLSGEYDPATPTVWANRAAKTLPFGQVVVFRGIGHDVIDSDPCGSKVADDFLANPRRKLDTECIDQLGAPEFPGNVEELWSGLSGMASKQRRLPFRSGHRAAISIE